MKDRSNMQEVRSRTDLLKNKIRKGKLFMKKTTILLLLFVTSAFAQPAKVISDNTAGGTWQIPFASTDNTISLSIQNNSNLEAKMSPSRSTTFRHGSRLNRILPP